jgi:hypothetical protein
MREMDYDHALWRILYSEIGDYERKEEEVTTGLL